MVEKMKNVQDLTPADIMSVYSGKAGRCCCGCAGKHYYNSQHAAAASKSRGYKVDADEVSDRMITKVLRILQSEEENIEPGSNHLAVKIGMKLYVIYPVAS